MIISIIININFQNTNYYKQLFIQSNHFLPLKIFFFNLKNLTLIITYNFSYNQIISNYFLLLKNIFFSNIKKFNTQTQIQKESKFYSTSKYIFIASKSSNRFSNIILIQKIQHPNGPLGIRWFRIVFSMVDRFEVFNICKRVFIRLFWTEQFLSLWTNMSYKSPFEFAILKKCDLKKVIFKNVIRHLAKSQFSL
jgi:hypothetical protein